MKEIKGYVVLKADMENVYYIDKFTGDESLTTGMPSNLKYVKTGSREGAIRWILSKDKFAEIKLANFEEELLIMLRVYAKSSEGTRSLERVNMVNDFMSVFTGSTSSESYEVALTSNAVDFMNEALKESFQAVVADLIEVAKMSATKDVDTSTCLQDVGYATFLVLNDVCYVDFTRNKIVWDLVGMYGLQLFRIDSVQESLQAASLIVVGISKFVQVEYIEDLIKEYAKSFRLKAKIENLKQYDSELTEAKEELYSVMVENAKCITEAVELENKVTDNMNKQVNDLGKDMVDRYYLTRNRETRGVYSVIKVEKACKGKERQYTEYIKAGANDFGSIVSVHMLEVNTLEKRVEITKEEFDIIVKEILERLV